MATQWKRELDPYDLVEFEMDFTPLLETGEAVVDFTVAPASAAAAAGLVVGAQGSAYAPQEAEPGVIRCWLSIDPAKRADKGFMGNGVALGVDGSITTNADPPRAFRREWLVRVKPL